MGDIQRIPSDYYVDFENESIIFYTALPLRMAISVVDINTGEERWSIRSRSPTAYRTFPDYDFSFMGALPILQEEGFTMYDIKDGSIIYQLNFVEGLNIPRAISNGYSHWAYIGKLETFFIVDNNALGAIDARTGELIWKLDGNYGDFGNADLFIDEGIALFYGTQRVSTAEILGAVAGATSSRLARTASRIADAVESGIQDNPIYYIDLNSGELRWENNFKTSGQTYPIITDDKVVLSDLVTYVIDRNSGDILWQTVTEERLDDEQRRRLLSEFTPFQLDASNRIANDNIIVDNSIFVVHPAIFDDGGDRRSVIIKRLDLDTGEEIWASDPERIVVSNFFFKHQKLFVQTSNRSMFASGEIRALDPATGAFLYEVQASSSISEPFMTPYHILFITPYDQILFAYDINTGERAEIQTPLERTTSLRHAGNLIYGSFSDSFYTTTVLAFLEPETFAVEREVEIPFHPRNMMTKGDMLYLYTDSHRYKSLLAVDFDRLETRGSFQVSTFLRRAHFDPPTTLPDVHFYVTEDGRYIYLTQDRTFGKYRIND